MKLFTCWITVIIAFHLKGVVVTALSINKNNQQTCRRQFLAQSSSIIAIATTSSSSLLAPQACTAAVSSSNTDKDTTTTTTKLENLTNEEIAKIITSDVKDKSFLVSALITREIYAESATFTDEIDTYGLDQWVEGTQKLFVADKSRVDLVGDVVVDDKKAEFRFDEDLMFRVPFLNPVVSLTGKVVLERDPNTGLITSYREFWDQDVKTVLSSVKLFN